MFILMVLFKYKGSPNREKDEINEVIVPLNTQKISILHGNGKHKYPNTISYFN